MAKKRQIEFENSNLILVGKGSDTNGNAIVKLSFPNERAFSIQTNGNLPKSHWSLMMAKHLYNLDPAQLETLEKESAIYISKFGTKKQKQGLKLYAKLSEQISAELAKMAKGGYVRPAYNIATSGTYLFETGGKKYVLLSTLFERNNDTEDALEIQDELRGNLGAIIIKNSVWKSLASGKRIKARASKNGMEGFITRIGDVSDFIKLSGTSSFEEGGNINAQFSVVFDDGEQEIMDESEVISLANSMWADDAEENREAYDLDLSEDVPTNTFDNDLDGAIEYLFSYEIVVSKSTQTFKEGGSIYTKTGYLIGNKADPKNYVLIHANSRLGDVTFVVEKKELKKIPTEYPFPKKAEQFVWMYEESNLDTNWNFENITIETDEIAVGNYLKDFNHSSYKVQLTDNEEFPLGFLVTKRAKRYKEGGNIESGKDSLSLQQKIDQINEKYEGVTASKTYASNRIQVVSPYFNTLSEIKRNEFGGSGLMERYGNTSSYVLYSNSVFKEGGEIYQGVLIEKIEGKDWSAKGVPFYGSREDIKAFISEHIKNETGTVVNGSFRYTGKDLKSTLKPVLKSSSTFKQGGEVVRSMRIGDAVMYKDKIHYISESNGEIVLTSMEKGAWGRDLKKIPVNKIDIEKDVRDMNGNKVLITDTFAEGGNGKEFRTGGIITFSDGFKFKKVSKEYAENHWQDEEIFGINVNNETEGVIESKSDLKVYNTFGIELGFIEDDEEFKTGGKIKRRTKAEMQKARENAEIDAYNYFVLNIAKNEIRSGWEYPEDAKDDMKEANEFEPRTYKVITARTMKQMGIADPRERWKTMEEGGNIEDDLSLELTLKTGGKVEPKLSLSDFVYRVVRSYRYEMSGLRGENESETAHKADALKQTLFKYSKNEEETDLISGIIRFYENNKANKNWKDIVDEYVAYYKLAKSKLKTNTVK